ncbi:MAG: hypothetical protein HY703_00975 [Gemmatimonadetes bacterium]|nr:hypothetical protein [Gemmatimonadota bacterium]
MNRCWLAALCLIGLLPAALGAQGLEDYDYENLSFRGLGFDYAFLWPNKVETTPAYSLRLDLGYLGPGVRIAPSISYWSSTLKGEEVVRLAEQLNRLPALEQRNVTIRAEELGSVDWSDLSLALDGHFVWTTALGVFTYIGAGAGVHALNGRGRAIDDTFVEDLLDSITAGVAAMAGVEYQPLDRFRLYAEARYTLLNDIQYGALRIGGALMLPAGQPAAVGAAAARARRARAGGGGSLPAREARGEQP